MTFKITIIGGDEPHVHLATHATDHAAGGAGKQHDPQLASVLMVMRKPYMTCATR
jgi:hypothetical protein